MPTLTVNQFPFQVIHVPDRLDSLHGLAAGRFKPPVHLFWQGREIDLSLTGDVEAFYSDAVEGADPNWINRHLLRQVWSRLRINRNVRKAWELCHTELRRNMEETRLKVQNAVLDALQDLNFALRGGAALQEFYVDYRPTEDVDAYTNRWEPSDFQKAVKQVQAVCGDRGWGCDLLRDKDVFKALRITVGGEDVLVDLGYDYRSQDPTERASGGLIISFPDVTAGKFRALVERTASRDIFDAAWAINVQGWDFVESSMESMGLGNLMGDVRGILEDVRNGQYDDQLDSDHMDPTEIKRRLE